MTSKKHPELLAQLGAPLKIASKSWGSVREADGVVFLVLWRDREIGEYVEITRNHKNTDDSRCGAKERLQHIELIRQGAICYIVMANAKDKSAEQRQVKDLCRDDAVFIGGELIERDGEWWIKRGKPKPIKELMPPVTAGSE